MDDHYRPMPMGVPQVGRRELLLQAKAKALVRSRWGDVVDEATEGTLPGGAALAHDGTAWVLAEDEPQRSLGAALSPFIAIAIVMILYAAMWRDDLLAGRYEAFVAASITVAVVVLFLPILLIPLSWKKSQKIPTVMGKRRVVIGPDHVRGIGDGYNAQFAWRDLRRVVRTRKLLACYTVPHGMIVVPASAFATRAEADAFFDQAKAWADAARVK